MKVLVLSHACVVSVNQQFFAHIESQQDWKFTIITPENWKSEYGGVISTEIWPEYEGSIIELPVFLSGNIPLHFYVASFISLLKENNPDFIYVHHEPYAVATFQLYLANFLSIKKPIAFFSWQNIQKNYPFPFRQMEAWVLKKSNHAFVGSESASLVWQKKGYLGPISILPAGIDQRLYKPEPENKIAHDLKQEEEEIIIGYVGRIIEAKGLRNLLLSLEKIVHLKWRLIVIGSGDYETSFRELAAKLSLSKRIDLLGYVPHVEVPKYLSAFDLVVLPSETQSNWREQFGRVIIEAMACSTPVIGSNSGEIPYLIQGTGGGLVFEEGDSDSFSQALEKLIVNHQLRKELSLKGRQSVLERYTSDTVVRKFVDIVSQYKNES